MKSLGFDPGARVLYEGSYELAEVTLERAIDGTYVLTASRDDGDERIAAIELRADFFDALAIALTRTREAAA